MKRIDAVFDDARLMDAVVVLRGVEMLSEALAAVAGGGGGGGGQMMSLQSCVQHLFEKMSAFPGLVILIADDSSASEGGEVTPELRKRLQFIVKFKQPNQEVRTNLWKKMMPRMAPLLEVIDFAELGRRWALNANGVRNAIFRAAARGALRPVATRGIRNKDLLEAGSEEHQKNRGDHADAMDRLFM
jgi:hypothetical protein